MNIKRLCKHILKGLIQFLNSKLDSLAKIKLLLISSGHLQKYEIEPLTKTNIKQKAKFKNDNEN